MEHFTPGTNIPIIEREKQKKKIQTISLYYLGILKKIHFKKEKKNIKKGIRFIFPLPKFHIV